MVHFLLNCVLFNPFLPSSLIIGQPLVYLPIPLIFSHVLSACQQGWDSLVSSFLAGLPVHLILTVSQLQFTCLSV
jgi:hypothetical protein